MVYQVLPVFGIIEQIGWEEGWCADCTDYLVLFTVSGNVY
jgi:hypothetical protein